MSLIFVFFNFHAPTSPLVLCFFPHEISQNKRNISKLFYYFILFIFFKKNRAFRDPSARSNAQVKHVNSIEDQLQCSGPLICLSFVKV